MHFKKAKTEGYHALHLYFNSYLFITHDKSDNTYFNRFEGSSSFNRNKVQIDPLICTSDFIQYFVSRKQF